MCCFLPPIQACMHLEHHFQQLQRYLKRHFRLFSKRTRKRDSTAITASMSGWRELPGPHMRSKENERRNNSCVLVSGHRCHMKCLMRVFIYFPQQEIFYNILLRDKFRRYYLHSKTDITMHYYLQNCCRDPARVFFRKADIRSAGLFQTFSSSKQ